MKSLCNDMYHLHFNSIKVRLELNVIFNRCEVVGFQFHKGAIRTEGLELVEIADGDFNSIKVRLEHCAMLGCSSFLHRFQFHKGAIRTSENIIPALASYPISIP